MLLEHQAGVRQTWNPSFGTNKLWGFGVSQPSYLGLNFLLDLIIFTLALIT